MFSPVHNHTEYSALDGLATAREIAERCRCIGCTAAGITDHGTVAGHLEFAKVMKQYDLKPIFGCELYHGVKTEFGKNERDQAHFVAGALTDQGLRNLWSMVDAASENFRYVGRVSFDICRKYREGVFATSACIQGLLGQGITKGNHDPLHMLNQYLDIYGDNFFIELHTYPGDEHEILNSELVRIAWERGVPLIYATDAHRARREDYLYADAYVAMSTGEDIIRKPSERKIWHPENSLYIMDEQEIRTALAYLPEKAVDEALRNSYELGERVDAQLPEIRRHLPAFVPKECPWLSEDEKEMSAGELFITKVTEGLEERYGDDAPDEVWDRAQREMEVFIDADAGLDVPGGLAHYFLQAWDFCEFCNQESIKRGPGRGSAAGAIVAYALRVTDIEPLKYDLIFERFYNDGRADGFPDIDNDFPVSKRKVVREYLMKRHGADKVRTIGTITRMKPKAVLDKTYKVCGITWDEKEELKKIVAEVPDIDILGADSIGWAEESDPGKTIYVMDHVGKEIVEWIEEKIENGDDDRVDLILQWLDICEKLCSRASGYGVHPSGVVVSDVSLKDELPCMWNTSQKIQVTCFPMSDVDKRGFVKQDLLGLRNLDTLEEWEREFKKDKEKSATLFEHLGSLDIDWSRVSDEDCPEEMWQMLDQGLTLGIFQIEKGYARQLCKQFKPRSIEDLGIIVALNRPGPIRSGAPDSFITRRNGGIDDEFDGRTIPILADILEPTYGWFLYQEQVIAFFSALGYNLSDADAVRKILGKKKPEAMRALRNGEGEWEGKGYKTTALAAGLDAALADVIWSKLEDFAKYSFNKSHAIAYATIAFRTLYAKYHGMAEDVIACIRTNPDEAGGYVSQGRRMGINVRPPHIMHSEADISAKGPNIYFGFSNIKGIGVGAAKFVCHIRDTYPINGFNDFVDAMKIEQKIWEVQRDEAKIEGSAFTKRSPGQMLGSNKVQALYDAGAFDDFDERGLTMPQIQKLEKELLQVIITDECDEIFTANGDQLEDLPTYADLELGEEGGSFSLPGVISNIDPKRTKKDGKAMGIVTIEYEGDSVEFVIFPREWASYRFLWKERTPGIFTLSKTNRGVRFEKGRKLTF